MSGARAAVLLACLAVLPGLPAEAAGPARIALIAPDAAAPFWQWVMQGAVRAGRDLGVSVTYSAPDAEPLADAQAALVGAAIAAGPAAICIDALDSAKVAPLLEKARKAKIPVIAFGAGVASPLVSVLAAPDEAAAGALAAAKLGAILGGSGAVGLIVRDKAAGAGAERRDGFVAALSKRHPGIRVAGIGYSGGDPKAAADLTAEMIKAEPGLRGLFCADEASAPGVLSALHASGLEGKVAVVGFDSGQAQVDAIRAGIMAGAVMRDPFRIGYKTVEAAVDILNGRRVPRRIDTGFHWYDRDTIDDPAIAALLHP